jgi:hypothetical protein
MDGPGNPKPLTWTYGQMDGLAAAAALAEDEREFIDHTTSMITDEVPLRVFCSIFDYQL